MAMQPSPIIWDSLWRCLCPPAQTLKLPRLPRRLSRRAIRTPQRAYPSQACLSARLPHVRASSTTTSMRLDNNHDFYSHNGAPAWHHRLRHVESSLETVSTPMLYERLREFAALGKYEEAMDIVYYLLRDRREKPSLRLYSAILHSYISPEAGTAGKVAATLQEMKDEGIELDAGACRNILEVLAVHPDYLLRTEILDYMRDRWYTLTPRDHNLVVAGLLRERQFELALQKMDDMIQQNIQTFPWLHDMAMYTLMDFGEVEEAYQIALLRKNRGDRSISNALWSALLDAASKSHHINATKLVWNMQVATSRVIPSSGTCYHVLNLAARTGDVTLATDVFRVLAERKTVFTQEHYEMLLEAYIHASDLKTALSVLVIMEEAGVTSDEGSASPLLPFLKQDPARPMEAFDILQELEAQGRKVPTAAVNVTIKAAIDLENLSDAVEIYKALHTISRKGPNTSTFNTLFVGCHRAGRKELAMFFAAEMIKLGIKPDGLTYDRLILVCLNAGEFDDAWRYYEEMRDQGHEPRSGTYLELAKACKERRDGKLEGLVERIKSSGVSAQRLMVIFREISKSDTSMEQGEGPIDEYATQQRGFM